MIKRLLLFIAWLRLKRLEAENDKMKYSHWAMPRKNKP